MKYSNVGSSKSNTIQTKDEFEHKHILDDDLYTRLNNESDEVFQEKTFD